MRLSKAKSSHGKKRLFLNMKMWGKKRVFLLLLFATVPQCQGLFFCVSRQTSPFICQQWQDNDYCLVCCGAICIVSDNRLTGERRTKKQKGPKSQDNDTDFSNRSITGCVHLKHWGTGGFSLPRLFRKKDVLISSLGCRFCLFFFYFNWQSNFDHKMIWTVSSAWHQHANSSWISPSEYGHNLFML